MLRTRLAASLVLGLSIAALLAQQPELPRTPQASPAPRDQPEDLATRLDRDCDDGQLDEFTLFQGALIAGGVRSFPELQQQSALFQETFRTINNDLAKIADRSARIDLLHRRLYERVLIGEYRAEYSELSRTLDEGHFNCVTATVLFQALSELCGIKSVPLSVQTHVLCCVPGQPTLYVETTCRDWRTSAIVGYPPSTQELLLHGRELSSIQLLGKVYYNRGVKELETGRFAQAAELLSTAVHCDRQDPAASENLLATYNNWALAACDDGEFATAQQQLLRGLALDACYAPLLANDLHIHQRWIKRLCEAGQFSTALELLEQGFRRRPDAQLFDCGRMAIYELWAEHYLAQGERQAGRNVLQQGLQRFPNEPGLLRQLDLLQAGL